MARSRVYLSFVLVLLSLWGSVYASTPNVDNVNGIGMNSGSTFIINGEGFGTVVGNVVVTITTSRYFGHAASASCPVTSVTDTSISCTYPASSTGVALGLKVTIGGVVATGVTSFATVVPSEASAVGQGLNVASSAKVSQSSENLQIPGPATNAIDGNVSSNAITNGLPRQSFQAVLPYVVKVKSIGIINRQDCCQEQLTNVSVYVSDSIQTPVSFDTTPLDELVATGVVTLITSSGPKAGYFWDMNNMPAIWFFVINLTPGYNSLMIAELQIITDCPDGCGACTYNSVTSGGDGTFSCSSCSTGFTSTVANGCCPTDTTTYSYPGFYCQAPTILQITPTSISTTTTTITINGFNFGNSASAINVTTDQGINCTNIVILAAGTQLKCTLSAGGAAPIDKSGVHVIITVGGVTNMDKNLALVYSTCQSVCVSKGSYCAQQGTYVGCFVDEVSPRDLITVSTDTRSIDDCVNFCASYSLPYAGLQSGSKCYCGSSYGFYGKANENDCNYACPVASNYTNKNCGGVFRSSIYAITSNCVAQQQNGATCLTSDACVSGYCVNGYCCNEACTKASYRCDTIGNKGQCSIGLNNSVSCSTNASCLSNNCVEGVCCDTPCADQCSSCKLSGSMGVCTKVGDFSSTFKCSPYVCYAGDCLPSCITSQYCAGGYACNLPLVGCFSEDCNNRVLSVLEYDSSNNNTVENCVAACFNDYHQISGLTNSTQCYCGDTFNTANRVNSSYCNAPCSGNSKESCGGVCYSSVYSPGVCIATSTTGGATTNGATTGAAADYRSYYGRGNR